MTSFNDREAAFENAYVHQQDLLFRAKALRIRALAEWAGRLMNKGGPELAAYRERMIGTELSEGDEALLRQLQQDLDAAGQAVPLSVIRKKLESLHAEQDAAKVTAKTI